MIVIYMVKNCVNGKVYIGSTNDISTRFSHHKNELNKGIHHNDHLQNSWNKYGSDSFEFKTLMVCPDKERNNCEQMFIDLYDSQNREFGYNIRDADAHSVSEETRLKMSKNNGRYWKGKTRPKELNKKVSEKLSGENNPRWKYYPRIVNGGKHHTGKRRYLVRFDGCIKKSSIDLFKLIDWALNEYPDEDLEISMVVLNNALLF